MDNISVPVSSKVPNPFNLLYGTYDNIVDNGFCKENLENVFTYNNAGQVPMPLTSEEEELALKHSANVNVAAQYGRIHCTSCNKHLGSAPGQHTDRYIHPLLNVLVCKSCYEFYKCADFTKDKDGSEIYCRWCAQGGEVICCSRCPYVFCLGCISLNLGTKKVVNIKASDEWLCFVCNSKQILELKILCKDLHNFTVNELIVAHALRNTKSLKIDFSKCCKKVNKKRKLSCNTDGPTMDTKQQKLSEGKEISLNSNIFQSQEKAEVVCTPDVLSLMGLADLPVEENKIEDKVIQVPESNKTKKIFVVKGVLPPLLKPIRLPNITVSSASVPPLVSAVNEKQKKKNSPAESATITQVNKQTLNSNKSDWFATVKTDIVKSFNQLTKDLNQLTQKKATVDSMKEMITVHNSLQELLSMFIANFNTIRKTLKTNFLNEVKHSKVQKKNKSSTTTIQSKVITKKIESLVPIPCTNETKTSLLKTATVNTVNVNNNPIEYIEILDDEVSEADDKDIEIHDVDQETEMFVSQMDSADDVSSSKPLTSEKRETELITSKACSNSLNSSSKFGEVTDDAFYDLTALKELDITTQRLIKEAIFESKVDKLLESNINIDHLNITPINFKKMASVRVVVQANYSPKTLRMYNKKYYKPFSIRSFSNSLSLNKLKGLLNDTKIIQTFAKTTNLEIPDAEPITDISSTTTDHDYESNNDFSLNRNAFETTAVSLRYNNQSDTLDNSGQTPDDKDSNRSNEAVNEIIEGNTTQENEDNTKINNSLADDGRESNIGNLKKSETHIGVISDISNNNNKDEQNKDESYENRIMSEMKETDVCPSENLTTNEEQLNGSFHNGETEDFTAMNETADIEDFLGGSIVIKSINPVNEIDNILEKHGIKEPNIVLDIMTSDIISDDGCNENE